MKDMRNSSVELLRFVFIYCILLIHIYGFGGESYPDHIFELGHSFTTLHHLSLNCLGQIGVTGFMFISGFYGIKTKKKKIVNLILITIFYASTIEFAFNPHIKVGDTRNLIHAFDLNWFISCYIVLCIIAPIIEAGIKQISQNIFKNIVIGLLLYFYGAHLIGLSNDHNFTFLLTIYITARYIKFYPPRFLFENAATLACTSALIIGGLPVLFSMAGFSHYPIMRIIATNNNILLLVLAASIVIISSRKVFYSPIINYLSSSVLSIYLITDNDLILHPLTKFLYSHIFNFYGFFLILAVCLVCIFIDKIRILLFDFCYHLRHHIHI